ncbi:MAG: prolyl oligopeptidase family serine peptidase [Gemmatimonadales bacterium]
MTRRLALHEVLLAAAVLAGAVMTASARAQGRPITERDLLAFHWVADPQISPDGSLVAYTLVSVNEKDNRYETAVWMVPARAGAVPQRLTGGPRDGAPRWAPDGKTLAFTRAVDDTSAAQIYLLSLAGGEPRKLTNMAKSAGPAVWSPDGHTIAFTSTTLPRDTAASFRDSASKKLLSDVHVITRAEYRSNDRGWLDPARHDHVWRVDATAAGEAPVPAQQITSGEFDEDGIAWSRDGSQVIFVSNRVAEPYYNNPDADVYTVPAGGGAIAKIIDIDGPIRGVVASPDGQDYAFAGWINPPHRESYTQSGLFVYRHGAAEALTHGGDADAGSALTGDQHPPRGGGSNPLIWSADGHSVVSAMTARGRSNLIRFDIATGHADSVTTGDHDIVAYTATPDGQRFAVTIGDAAHIGDLYSLDPASHALTQLTHVNDSLWSQLRVPAPERITYRSFDGTPIEAWVYKPPDFEAGKRYPLILNIHGGPHAAYGNTFFHEAAVMAARGYVVLTPNPRGSTSYGEHFGNIIQYHYPGDDYRDLMIGVDTLVARGYIDPQRMGVTGGSGGGLLTNWVVGHTHRFAAAVSMRSIADWAAWWYTADFTLFTPSWFREPPFRDPVDYARRSPITYIEQVTTPLMLIEGEADSRTPSGSGGMTMFRALKALHRPAVMVSFPGETHELSRSGKPRHRLERLTHILNWFDKYLQNKSVAEYDQQ